MKDELFSFQKIALTELRNKIAEARGSYHRTHSPQVISFTAPTGAGKTIIMASLIEEIYHGDAVYAEQQNAIFVWLSDSPQLNEQSKGKIDSRADRISYNQCVVISDESFDQEVLDDGHIYFLNTQKLGKSSNLTKHGDNRLYTIWETLSNTAKEKSDRLYFIIDEAHRGMQGREAGKATSIMQKFILGSQENNLPAMPIVIGMSATVERFNRLVGTTTSTIHKVAVKPDDVRSSGLLKDRIIITYPEDRSGNKDMAVLQAAADDWIDKWDHWQQYCYEQHYAYVNPVFVVQVANGTDRNISETDLDDCVKKIEERIGFKFTKGQVVHTFGQTSSTVVMNGLEVPYVEPSRIVEDKNIRVVFFKENLSTGWDCPRAETMMSFRHANDATYIAQLLGRMVRTPMQMHIQVDDTLNDVHLFLPYFNEDTVKDVVNELQNSEGGAIPTEITGESIEHRSIVTLSVNRPRTSSDPRPLENQIGMRIDPSMSGAVSYYEVERRNTPQIHDTNVGTHGQPPEPYTVPRPIPSIASGEQIDSTDSTIRTSVITRPQTPVPQPVATRAAEPDSTICTVDDIDREAIVRFINDAGLLTYDVRRTRIDKNYLISMFKIARLLSQSGLDPRAKKDAVGEVVGMIRSHIEGLQSNNQYEDLVSKAMEFKLSSQIFDVFGESVDNYTTHDTVSSTDTDIDRQFKIAETKLGGEGVGLEYGRRYANEYEPNLFKIDVIIFVADSHCMESLNIYAKDKFHALNDSFRRYVPRLEERFRRQYDSIVSDGDVVSKHNFRLPENINVELESGGEKYSDHLFVNENGFARFRLNNWENGVLEEERRNADYVCWFRNPPRKPWSLCIPYKENEEYKAAYPDFIVIRRDSILGYVADILEPHSPDFADNLGKAKGFAEYARQNPGVGRIELIRKGRDISGSGRFLRLDMSKSAIRDKVLRAMTPDELDHLFDTDGVFE